MVTKGLSVSHTSLKTVGQFFLQNPQSQTKPEPQVHLITNECCGNFKLPCGSSNFTVWNTTDTAPAGTVSILYSDGCAENLTVSVIDSSGNTDTFQVPPENTISRTYKDLVMVSLTCPSGPGNNNCSGKYCITISYSVQD